MEILFFFLFSREGFGGNVSPFRVRYLISILRPVIRPYFQAKLCKQGQGWGGGMLSLWVKFSSNLQQISTSFRWAIKALFTISDCKTLCFFFFFKVISDNLRTFKKLPPLPQFFFLPFEPLFPLFFLSWLEVLSSDPWCWLKFLVWPLNAFYYMAAHKTCLNYWLIQTPASPMESPQSV